ncbi:MAG: hypothetical protein ACLRRK_00430 [Parasutterella sp.]
MIIGDYDCDGATAVSVGILGLQALGAFNVSYLIPDRDKDGYGLSPQLVDRAALPAPSSSLPWTTEFLRWLRSNTPKPLASRQLSPITICRAMKF